MRIATQFTTPRAALIKCLTNHCTALFFCQWIKRGVTVKLVIRLRSAELGEWTELNVHLYCRNTQIGDPSLIIIAESQFLLFAKLDWNRKGKDFLRVFTSSFLLTIKKGGWLALSARLAMRLLLGNLHALWLILDWGTHALIKKPTHRP